MTVTAIRWYTIMIELIMYTTCIGVTCTDAVENALINIGVRYSEMNVKNKPSILIIDSDCMQIVIQELLKLQCKITMRKG